MANTVGAMESVRVSYRIIPPASSDSVTMGYEFLTRGLKMRKWIRPEISDEPPYCRYFDGKTGYRVHYAKGDPTRMESIWLSSSVPEELQSQQSPLHLCLLPLPGRRQTLLELIQDGVPEPVPSSHVEMETLLFTMEGPVEGVPDVIDYELHLAVDRDFLPVSIKYTRATARPDSPHRTYRMQVREFRQVDDLAFDRKRWLPWLIELERGFQLVVQTAEVNPATSDADFVPSPMTGTEIIDERTPGRRKVTIHDAAAVRGKLMRDLAGGPTKEEERAGNPNASDPIRAKPAGWPVGWWSMLLVGMAGVMVILAWRFSRFKE